MGWLTPRRSRSFAGSQGAEIPRRGGGPSRVPARVVLLLLAMVAALAGQAFAQTTPNPGDRWTPGGVWTHDVTTTSLIARLTPQQSVTIDGGSRQWANAAIDACPWTTVTRPLPSTTCTELKAYNANGFPNYNPLTLTNFAPTQTMIDNGGVVIRLRWRNYNSPAGNNVGMVEWVPLVPPLGATLVLTPASISENAGVSTVTATLNQATSAATTVTVSAAAVAPAVAGDFALSTNKILTIAASATTSTGVVTITASNNGLDAPDKSVTVSGTVSGGNGAAAPSDVTLTITDDDALPTVTLGLSPSSVSESSGVSTVTATLSGASSEAVTVTVAAAAGTGAVAADFTLSGTTELTIAARDTTSMGPVTVTANGNTVDSPDKSVTVSGTVTGGNNIAAPSNVTLTLTDDETLPTLTLALSSSSVSESGGVSTVTATLSGASSEAVTVTVGAAAGAGADADDFTLSSSDKLTIAAGYTTSTGPVTVTANGNTVDSPDKSVTVSGTVSGGNGVAAPSSVTLTITDDDALPTALVLTPASISEDGGVSTVTATLNRALSVAVTVTVSASPGAGTDFTLSSAPELTIAAGATTSTGTAVTITANDNDVEAPDKSVTVSGTAPATGEDVEDPPDVTLTLLEDDMAGFVFEPSGSLTVAAGGAASTYTVKLSSEPTGAVTVSIASDNGDVTVDPSSLTFDAANWATGQTVTVTAAADDDDFADTATLSHRGEGGGYDGAPGALSAAVAGGGARIAASGGGSGTPRLYVVNGHEVTVTEEPGVPPGVEIDLPSDLGEAVSVTFGPVEDAPRESGSFSLEHEGASAMVDVSVDPVPSGGVELCLTPPAGVREAAGRAPGREVTLLHYTGGAWTAVAGSTWDESRSQVCAGGVRSFSPFAVGYANTKPAFDATTLPALAFTVDEAIDPVVTLPAATGGDGALLYALTPALPPGLAFDETSRTLSGTPTEAFAATEYRWTATDRDGDETEKPLTFTIEVKPALAEAGGGRIAASGGLTETRESVYVFNGHLVTVTEEAGVPPGVEIDLPSNLAEDVSVTFKPVEEDTPQESDSFSLEHSGSRVMVDVDVTPAPTDGVKLCLTPPAGMRETARRASGRDVELLHYTGGAWTAVKDSTWDESRSRVCGTVTTFSDFSAGYANTKPVFEATQPPLAFTVDVAIDPAVTLPAATGGDGTLLYALTPALPPGLAFDETSRTLSGTPTEAFDRTTYSLMATDRDGDETEKPLAFTIEVKPALAEARARLKAINESVLPELSRALWGSAMDAVTGRLESPDAAAPTVAAGLERAAGFVRANEGALEEGDMSWKELLGGESFAFGLAEGGSGFGGVVAWGSGDWRRLSRDEDALDWSGDAFSAHLGADAALRPGLRAGLAASWFSSDVDYTDRSGDAAVKGSHESRMTSLTPYVGWDGGDGTRLWGAAGYGWGEIEIVDEELRERFGAQKADSRFLAGAAGGSARVWSEGALTVDAKASGEATRFEAKDNGSAIAGVTAETRRLRVAAEGSRAWALADGASLTPTLEAGVRWDGGDGATGAGLEAGGGLSWSDPSRGLTVEATGRALLVHNSDVEEWGASGSMRLAPGADGLGLSFGLSPSWGVSGSGMARLWNEGVAAARPADGGGGNRARLETELGYGLPAFAGAGVTTPYAGVGLAQGGERDMRAGVRVGLGAGFDLGVETARRETTANTGHGIGFDLRIRW